MANTNGNKVLATISSEDVERNKAEGFPDLNPMKRAFALRYVIDYNHRQAAIESGFAASRGIKLIRDPLVSAMIAFLQEETHISNVITEDFIRAQFLNLIPMLSGEQDVPILSPDGVQMYGKKFYPGELKGVITELAKSTKFYENGSGGGGGNVTVNIDVAALLGHGPDEGVTIEGETD